MKLVIITITKDDETGLKTTMDSIAKMPSALIRAVLVKDGSEKPFSVEFWGRYDSMPISFVQADDTSLYNAMNHCVRYLENSDIEFDYCVFINSGDEIIYSADFVERVESLKTPKLIFGISAVMFPNGENLFYPNPRKVAAKSEFELWLRHFNPVHQAVWFPSAALESLYYDETFKVQADTKLILTQVEKFGFEYFPQKISVFFANGYSSNYASSSKVLNQAVEQLFIERNLKNFSGTRLCWNILKFGLKYLLWAISGENIARLVHAKYVKYIKS